VLVHAARRARVLCILKRTGQAFLDDNVTRLGAALAFYTTIAVAPLMVLSVAVAGFFLDDEASPATPS
jgi:membrane protein